MQCQLTPVQVLWTQSELLYVSLESVCEVFLGMLHKTRIVERGLDVAGLRRSQAGVLADEARGALKYSAFQTRHIGSSDSHGIAIRHVNLGPILL